MTWRGKEGTFKKQKRNLLGWRGRKRRSEAQGTTKYGISKLGVNEQKSN
jgi:hypothetical protein